MDLLQKLRRLSVVEHHEHIWENGEYRGCMVTYKYPAHPDLKTMFHPYIPLMVTGEVQPRLTRDYFLQNGLSVPGETNPIH